MKRRLNLRLLAWTLGGFLVVLVVVHLIHQIQIARNSHVLLERANRAFAEKNFEQAETLLRRYLSREPNDAEALSKHALVLDKLFFTGGATRTETILAMNRALRRNPDDGKIRDRAVVHLIQAQRYDEAIEQLDYLLQSSISPAEMHYKIGWCHERNDDFPAAAKNLQSAIQADPAKIESYLLLAEIYRVRMHQAKNALRTLNDLVKANPKSHRSYLARGRFYQQARKFPEAEKDIQQAQRLAPQNTDVLLAAVNLATAQGKANQARKHLENGLAANPKNAALYSEMAALELTNGRRSDAMEWLRSGLKEIPKSRTLRFQLADLLLDDHQFEAAAKAGAKLKSAGAPKYKLDYLQARMAMSQEKWDNAVQSLVSITEKAKTSKPFHAKVLVLLGWCELQTGKTDQALHSFRAAVKLQPAWTPARFGLGQAYLANGDVSEALEYLRPLKNSADVPKEFWKVYGKALVLKNARAVRPRWNEAEFALGKAVRIDPRDAEVAVWQAELLTLQNRFAAADKLLQNALVLEKSDARLWIASAVLAARQRDFKKAFQVLSKAKSLLGDKVDLRLAKGRLLLEQRDRDVVRQIAELADGADAFSQTDQARLWNGLAHQFYHLGDRLWAKALWKRLADSQKDDLSSRLYLFELALRRDPKAAQRWLDDIRRIEGNDGVWQRYCLASLLLQSAEQSKPTRDRLNRLVSEIAKRRPNWTKLYFLRGQIADRAGNTDQVIADYWQALQLGEQRTDMIYRLAYLLTQRRRYADAGQVVTSAEWLGPLPSNLARLGAEIALENRNTNRALRLANQAIPEDSRDYRDLIWFAQIRTKAGKTGEAEAIFRRLVQHSGGIPDVWVAWVANLASRNQRTEAQSVITQMKKALPANRLQPALARCYQALGEARRAEETLLRLLKDRPNDFVVRMQLSDFYIAMDEPSKAEPYLRKLLDPSFAVPGPLLPRVRRRLALIWAQQGDIDKALALLDANRRSSRKSISDDRAKWAALSYRKSEQLAAIKQFEKSVADRPATNEEMLWLAGMMERAGMFDKARHLISGLLAKDGSDPRLLAWQVRLLLKQRNVVDARTFLDRLAKREPDSDRLVELRNRYEKELKKMEAISQ